MRTSHVNRWLHHNGYSIDRRLILKNIQGLYKTSVFSLKQVPCNVIQSICELMSTSINNNFSRSNLVLRFKQLRFSMLNSLLVFLSTSLKSSSLQYVLFIPHITLPTRLSDTCDTSFKWCTFPYNI